MATESVRLLVLAHTAFGENKLALHTLSEAYGRRSFLVRVGPKAPMGLFLPMNLLEADVTENPKSSLWSARNFQPLSPLNGLRGNPYKNSIALFMSEVLYRAVREEGGYEPGLYERCAQQVLTLDALTAQFSNFPIRFLIELCTALGFQPSAEGLAPLSGEFFPVMQHFLAADFSEAMLIPLTGQQRNDLAAILIRYLEIHTESTLHIRSLAVLREIYR